MANQIAATVNVSLHLPFRLYSPFAEVLASAETSFATSLPLLLFHAKRTTTIIIAESIMMWACMPGPPGSHQSQLKRRLPNTALPDGDAAANEVVILARHKSTSLTVVQRIAFTTLPAEIRNRIYDFILLSENKLIVAAPCYDDLMWLGDQPSITRVNRQLRSETLVMFYTINDFIAFVNDFDFTGLVRWAKCITSTPSPPKVKVHVRLLNDIRCAYQLLDLVRGWRDLEGATIHLTIHGRRSTVISTERSDDFDQRELVVSAIRVAEALRAKGDFTEAELVRMCYSTFEHTDRNDLGSIATCTDDSCIRLGNELNHIYSGETGARWRIG